MKKICLTLFAAMILTGCSLNDTLRPFSWTFTDTGCAGDTKSGDVTTKSGSFFDEESWLILRYTQDGLLVTRTNATMNCAIKNGGITCDVSLDGDVIRYEVHQKSDLSANCMCLVEEMSSTVSGLKAGHEYTLYYYLWDELPLVPITFTYNPGMVMTIDPDLYAATLKDIGGGVWVPDI